MNQMYNEYFFRYDNSPLLIINTNDIDFVNNKKDLEELIEEHPVIFKEIEERISSYS